MKTHEPKWHYSSNQEQWWGEFEIRENPGLDRKEIKEAVWKQFGSEMYGSVLSATITLLRHNLIRQEGGKPAKFYPN